MGKDRVVNVHTARLPHYGYNCLICQNAAASFKQEMISSTLGRTLRSARQHSSTAFHSSLLNPRRLAPSGFCGRTPPVIARMTIISDWISV